MNFRSVRGMHDLFGSELERWVAVEKKARQIFNAFGYPEIRTPILEYLNVFKETVGEQTDIVEKQMYTVNEGEEQLALRPEGTAPFLRAVIEHNLHQTGRPQRFHYYYTLFRHERPQKGRLRQFHQFGAELINDPSPEADSELIILLDAFLKTFEITDFEIRLNSVGCKDCRPAYKERLKAYYQPSLSILCSECQRRFDRSVLRILDCKNETCRKITEKAPLITHHLCDPCKTHDSQVQKRLHSANVSFILDPKIVRGLDYYIRTAFEFTSNLLGSQSALAGGGRYDGLSQRFGAAPFPAAGFGLGMERLMMALDAKAAPIATGVTPFYYFAALGEASFDLLYPLSLRLKRQGVSVEMLYGQRKLKDLLKNADRSQAKFTLILGDREIEEGTVPLKNMLDRTQENLTLVTLEEELIRRASCA